MRRLIYEACVLAILLCGCQIWVLTPQLLSLLERTVNDHLRVMTGVSRGQQRVFRISQETRYAGGLVSIQFGTSSCVIS